MMRFFYIFALAVPVLAQLCQASDRSAPQTEVKAKEIGRTTERELSVVLTSSFGAVTIARGEPEKIVVVESEGDQEEPRVRLGYDIRNRVGYLDVALGETDEDGEESKGSFHLSNIGKGQWNLKFSDAIPISLDVQLGAGKGTFDFSGLLIKDFNLSTGASDVSISFDQPNRSRIDNMNIESGVSKFDGQNLGNANFRSFRFQGGVGAYTLDFGGMLTSEVDVDAEVGFGVLTIIIPPRTGARVYYQKSWASSLEIDESFRSTGENEYTSDNYTSAEGKMNIRLDSGLGSIRIRRK